MTVNATLAATAANLVGRRVYVNVGSLTLSGFLTAADVATFTLGLYDSAGAAAGSTTLPYADDTVITDFYADFDHDADFDPSAV